MTLLQTMHQTTVLVCMFLLKELSSDILEFLSCDIRSYAMLTSLKSPRINEAQKHKFQQVSCHSIMYNDISEVFDSVYLYNIVISSRHSCANCCQVSTKSTIQVNRQLHCWLCAPYKCSKLSIKGALDIALHLFICSIWILHQRTKLTLRSNIPYHICNADRLQ